MDVLMDNAIIKSTGEKYGALYFLSDEMKKTMILSWKFGKSLSRIDE